MSRGLGRGFESLIPTNLVEEEFDPTRSEDESVSRLIEVDLEDVERDEEQPRKNFSKESLAELGNLKPLEYSPLLLHNCAQHHYRSPKHYHDNR